MPIQWISNSQKIVLLQSTQGVPRCAYTTNITITRMVLILQIVLEHSHQELLERLGGRECAEGEEHQLPAC